MESQRKRIDTPGLGASEVDSEEEFDSETIVVNDNVETSPVPEEDTYNGFWQREAKRMARIPRIYLGAASLISVVLSVVAFTAGGFEVGVDNAGWQSRGTTIANRQTQLMLAETNREYLFTGGESAWVDLLSNVQKGWDTSSLGNTDEDDEGGNPYDEKLGVRLLTGIDAGFSRDVSGLRRSRKLQPHFRERLLQEADLTGCDIDWYFNETQLEEDEHLWPIWKATSASTTLLSSGLMYDVCVAEQNTQRILEANGLCFGCEDGCLPAFSPVLYARLLVDGGFSMDCQQLSDEWANYQSDTESQWATCVSDLKIVYDPNNDYDIPESCPVGFSPAFVEANFDETKWMTYTSSIFPTGDEDIDAMYEIVDQFDQGSARVIGVYDTQYEGFNTVFTDEVVGRDMLLACASAFITALAILVHTKSPFITGIGLMQIILSFPLSFFVYTFLGGLKFFPFLNFIGVFVVFALGADDIFVAVDKWKNARIAHPSAETAVIAAIALPDAAGAMFLTSFTTAIAFFGTAICPVAPIKMFAIFCGLLIMFDYLMCCLLVFPALCIYDTKLMADKSGCCNACSCFERKRDEEDEDDDKLSLIHRIMNGYYRLLHRFRWFLLVLSLGGFGAAAWGATTLELPTTSEVRLVDVDAVQFEQNFVWREKLLISALVKLGGSEVLFGFGLEAADTGDLNDPQEWSQMVLDSTFDAAPEESQKFLESFCPELYSQDFAVLPYEGFECAFNRFATWLEEQSASATPDEGYIANCGGATGIPVPEANFDACLIEWSKQNIETSILSNDGKVRIIFLPFVSRVRFDSPFDDLENEWNLVENWTKDTAASAPAGINKFFFSSMDFWWFDTNSQMLSTAYGAASIALGAAALIIFLSSRSFVLTLFATFTICYVLASVTATLVAIGWTLGFLESICFAILIGVSVDFVIHFVHAYAHASGDVDRHHRTQDALIRMGPSILAAGVTTVGAAIIMLFTTISFFQKFALILFMTIIQATVGSFVVFLTLTDCIGPSNPTYMVDKFLTLFSGKKEEPSDSDGNINKRASPKEKEKDDTMFMTTDSSRSAIIE